MHLVGAQICIALTNFAKKRWRSDKTMITRVGNLSCARCGSGRRAESPSPLDLVLPALSPLFALEVYTPHLRVDLVVPATMESLVVGTVIMRIWVSADQNESQNLQPRFSRALSMQEYLVGN